MAIFIPGALPIDRTVTGTTMLTIGAQGSNVATPATTNRKRPGRITYRNGIAKVGGFTALDNLIVSLDAFYDALPDDSAWVTYATNIAGNWQLCANCQPDAAAKKLYRQYNFNRFLLGLTRADVPIDNTEFCENRFGNVEQNYQAVPPWVNMNVDPTLGFPFYAVANVGLALLNPLGEITAAAGAGNVNAPSPEYSFADAVTTALGLAASPGSHSGNAVTCFFMPSGAPGLNSNVGYSRF